MYLSHFDLKEKPFKISTDAKFLWLGERHKEGLSTLRYALSHGDGYVLLTGDVGTGKTTMANALMNELGDEVIVRKIAYPDIETLEFFKLILSVYGVTDDFQTKGGFLTCFESFLRSSHAKGKRVALIIDEAQRLSAEHLEELMHLSNIEEDGARLFNLVFVGQNDLNQILSAESNRALRQRVCVNYNLGSLSEDETGAYISHRLKVASCDRALFSPETVREIFRFSGGIPRLINVVCDLSLLITYLEGGEIVTPETIGKCIQRLRLPSEQTVLDPSEGDSKLEPEDKVEESEQVQVAEGFVDPKETENEYAPRPVWRKAGFALALLIVALCIVLLFSRLNQKPPNAPGPEPLGQVVMEAGVSSRDKESADSMDTPGSGPEGPAGALQDNARMPGKDTLLDTSEGPAPEQTRQTGIQDPGTEPGRLNSETPAKLTEEIESGRVIDWLLEKRSEQK